MSDNKMTPESARAVRVAGQTLARVIGQALATVHHREALEGAAAMLESESEHWGFDSPNAYLDAAERVRAHVVRDPPTFGAPTEDAVAAFRRILGRVSGLINQDDSPEEDRQHSEDMAHVFAALGIPRT